MFLFSQISDARFNVNQRGIMAGTYKLLSAAALLVNPGARAEKSLDLADLPPPVRKTIQDQTKGDQIKRISQETEKGRSQYEIESMRNGKHRDFNVDSKGALLEVEDETTFDTIPAPAKDAITKKIAGGKIGMVEMVTTADGAKLYEAAYTAQNGKKHEVRVEPDGAEVKE
jgi:hypothetical protein